jgi:cytochrome c553
MADGQKGKMPGEKGVEAALSLFCIWENNKKMIKMMGYFGAALVASLIGLFVISSLVNAIYGVSEPQMALSSAGGEGHKAQAANESANAGAGGSQNEEAPKATAKSDPVPGSRAAAKIAAAGTGAAAGAAATATSASAKVASAAKPAASAKPKKHPGRKIYLRKGACAACHGRKGRRSISYYPSIAGQDKKYIIGQIKDIISGKRRGGIDKGTGHPRAEAMKGALVSPEGKVRITPDDIEQMADWLTHLKPAAPRPLDPPASAEVMAEGKKLYKKCKSCHGKEGKKPLKGYPYLAGQKHIYLVQQITDIRDGKRKNGKVKIMVSFVKKLTDAQINALASYLSQIDRTK